MRPYLTLHAATDLHVSTVAGMALNHANATKLPVVFTFQHIAVVALPGDTVDGLLSDWIDDTDARLRTLGS